MIIIKPDKQKVKSYLQALWSKSRAGFVGVTATHKELGKVASKFYSIGGGKVTSSDYRSMG